MNFSIKYRPKSLNEIIGHEKIVTELQKRSKDKNFPNVMLFSGITGVGKTTLELIIAKNILCLNTDENGNSCNSCDICKAIDNDVMNNYCYIFNASNLGVEDMREVENIAISKSLSVARKKVIIIDEMQELSNAKKAQKNILKILEKPLKSTYFILGTMNEFKVDKAILNRSVKYRLNELNDQEIGECLIRICKKENIDFTDKTKVNALVTVAQNSEGSLRTAISYIERVIESKLWNSDDLANELGLFAQDRINYIVDDLLSGKVELLKNKIDEKVIDKISSVLLLYYKVISGYELEMWRQNALDSIGRHSKEKVEYALTQLYSLTKYFYISKSLIDFTLLNIINHNKEEKQSVRRRAT